MHRDIYKMNTFVRQSHSQGILLKNSCFLSDNEYYKFILTLLVHLVGIFLYKIYRFLGRMP